MLEQLDQINGVTTSSANHSGGIIRISVADDALRADVAKKAHLVLAANDAKPSRLSGDKSIKALTQETWRGIDRINELSAIEFRTIIIDRLKMFAKNEKMSQEVTDQLIKIAKNSWEAQAKSIDIKVPPHKTGWTKHCRSVADAFIEEAKPLLSDAQVRDLKAAVRNEMVEP